MKTLILAEIEEGGLKKTSLEIAVFAQKLGGEIDALVLGSSVADAAVQLGNYGVKTIYHINDNRLDMPEAQAVTTAIAIAMEKSGSDNLIMAKNSLTDSVAPRVAARENAAVASNVMDILSVSADSMEVKRGIFTGKAFANTLLKGSKRVLTVKKNSVEVVEASGSAAQVELLTVTFSDTDFAVKRTGIEKATGKILLPEAQIVVSGGRGMKGPENWNLIEDLADALGAATGCSKPVSDLHWRPHHEHVGQTGIKVSPNLYIAVGISGAIQHVAGINSSKFIVAINKDAEAPIFKAADYGIVGDAFEILPKLTAAVKADA